MECPNCKRTLGENATFCAFCGWKVGGDPLDRTVTNLARVGREAVHTSIRLAGETATAMQPVVDKAAKAITSAAKSVADDARPTARRVAKAGSKAVDRGAKAARKAVEKTAEAAEKVSRKVKEKSR